jgi:hypothetical protein
LQTQQTVNSIYNAMALEFRRRVSYGLNVQANWTWAKAIDDQLTNVQTAGLDILDPKLDRGNSDYARRHMINVNGTYQIPFGRGQTTPVPPGETVHHRKASLTS